jgi:plastocyanin
VAQTLCVLRNFIDVMLGAIVFKKIIILASVITLFSLAIGTVSAHEGRAVGDYNFVVGFLNEPAFEGFQNGVSIRITKEAEEHDEHAHGAIFNSPALATGGTFEFMAMEMYKGLTIPYHNHLNHDMTGLIMIMDDAEMSGTVEVEIHDDEFHGGGVMVKPGTKIVWVNNGKNANNVVSGKAPAEETLVGVEGQQDTLQVSVTHVESNVTKTMNLRTVFGDPGHYVADMVPTATGVYQFRVFGSVEANPVDETFISRGGGGDFNDIQPAADLQFPSVIPAGRELENAVRGAQASADQATDDASSAGTMGLIGIVLGALGAIAGGTSLIVSLRK